MALFNREKNTEDDKTVNASANGAMNTRQPITNEEQMALRQSAPRPTVKEAVANMFAKMRGGGNGVINGFQALEQVIGKEQINEANQILQKYKSGKANLEKKIVDNEQWYKMRHWECMRGEKDQVQPTSGWLFNCIANKHADAMDNFPSPNILPREDGDKEEAKMLTSIIPVILDQCDFEQTYSDVWMDKLKNGTGVYGVFWNQEKLNGLGDVDICEIDLINLFWEPGVTDIQKSKNVFHVELMDNDVLINLYPQLAGKLGGKNFTVATYLYDDTVDTTDKTPVVDWYYKKGGKLHYCKYVNDVVLFATENERQPRMSEEGEPIGQPMAETGLYNHGLYPFHFDVLFPVKGTPCGFGYIDVGKNAQEYIDRGNQAVMMNMLSNAKPRYFIRTDGSVNEQEYANMENDFIHVDGNLGQDSIVPVQSKPLNSIYVQVINDKIDELKETTGNRDVSTGGTSGGVTSASGLAAQMEAGSKLSRDANKAAYRNFRNLCLMVIELIRQFYDMPRCFRIMGENGTMQYVTYSNAGLAPKSQGVDFGVDMGNRIPLFDIEVTAQKQSPYSKIAQNDLALQFFGAGFFNPQLADQALACLDMMDFDRKEFVMQKISQNGGMYQQMMMMQQQMMMLAQMVDKTRGGNEIAASLANQFGIQLPTEQGGGTSESKGTPAGAEHPYMQKARQRVADSTSPT